jgi:hypothetical protein
MNTFKFLNKTSKNLTINKFNNLFPNYIYQTNTKNFIKTEKNKKELKTDYKDLSEKDNGLKKQNFYQNTNIKINNLNEETKNTTDGIDQSKDAGIYYYEAKVVAGDGMVYDDDFEKQGDNNINVDQQYKKGNDGINSMMMKEKSGSSNSEKESDVRFYIID